MTRKYFASILRFCLLVALLAGLTLPTQFSVYALTTLTLEPLTWNVIGLDSNNVNVGPNRFPVGARVCNTGVEDATNVTADFQWVGAADPYIDLRAGSLTSINLGTLTSNSCADAYFEVEIDRDPSAYDHTRQYRIDVTAGNVTGTISTPTPREVYVEYLISQNRNAITDVKLNGTSVPAGGSMNLLVGNTYTITLEGGTATQGYEQFEAFINFPNTIFQILSVNTTYSANTSSYVTSPNDKLYADACLWENDINNPNYLSCVGIPGKTGGSNVVTTYTIKIIGGGGTTQTLNTLLYDFSGSSFHYNADYSLGARFANIIDPTNVGIVKSFSPNPTNVNGISALTITLTNPNTGAISGYNFTDPLPSNLVVANPPNASTTSCGTPTFAPVAGATSISFSNGTIGANGSCTIKVNVTPSTTGSFLNTTDHLFVDLLDTGKFATSSLTVNTTPPPPPPPSTCTTPVELARWTMDPGQGTTTPPAYFSKASDVAIATASYTTVSGANSISTTQGTPVNSWGGTAPTGGGGWAETPASMNNYFQFNLDTSNYGGVYVIFDAGLFISGDWANPTSNVYVNTSADGGAYSVYASYPQAFKGAWTAGLTTLAASTGSNTTTFRFGVDGAGNNKPNATFYLDNVIFMGCPPPNPPTITKTFSPDPIAVNGVSTLTFTLSNSNAVDFTGVTFTDTLPTGLEVAATPTASTTCGGTPTWAPTAGATSLTFGSPTGAIIPASSSCTVSVNITGTAAGAYQNVSGFISSTNGGTNSGATGSASASLTVIQPPSIDKLFSPNPILANGTTTLTFTITNPNQNNDLTGLSFTDTFPMAPAAMTAASPLTTTNTCGGSLQDDTGGVLATDDPGIRLIGGTLVAGGTCTVSVNVTAPTIGSYVNTSGVVSSTNGGTGNAASDTLTVNPPNPAIAFLKQVGPTATGPWSAFLGVTLPDDVYYQFTVENTGDVPLSPVSVTDPIVSTASCVWPATLPVAVAGNDDHIATCVVGPVAATSGSHINTATAGGTYGGTPYSSTSSSATYANPELTLDKTAAEISFLVAGDTLNYSYLVTNSGFVPLPGPVTVADDKATVTCPNVNTVGDNDDWFDPGESITCTASYTVQPADATAGFVTNTATATVDSVDSNQDSVTINQVRPDLTITKSNDVSGLIAQNGTFTWTLTVANGGIADAVFTNGQTILSDPLPAGPTYGAPSAGNFSGITNSGNINCSVVAGTLSCTAAGADVTIGVGGSFTVDFTVTPTTSGDLANTATVDPNGNITEGDDTNNTGLDTVSVFDAQPSKSIVTTSEPSTVNVAVTERVAIGEMIRYRLVTMIPQGSFTNVQLVDGLPTGLQFLDDGTATVAFVCNGGAACMTSSTLAGVGLVVNGSSSAVSPTFVLPGSVISGGPFGSGTDVTFGFGNITNSDADGDSEYIVVEFNALVLNVNSSVTINQGVDNQTGLSNSNNRQNDVTLFVDSSQVGAVSPNVTVAIAEPAITSITKSVSPASGPYLPGDFLTYTMLFSNNATGNNATTAFDIVLTDTFDANLILGVVNVSSTQGTSGVDTCAGGTTFTTSDSTVGQLVTVNVSCLGPGESVTVTVATAISGSTTSGTTISNSAGLTYTSLPGAQGNCATSPFTCTDVGTSGSGTGERNGDDGSGDDDTFLNNYATTSNTTNTTVTFGSITITKDAIPNDAQDFAFTGTGPNSYNFGGGFSLDDDADGTLPSTQTFTPLVAGSYSVTEGTVGGWSLTGLTCIDPDTGSATDLGTATATIDLDAGENVSCTFTNESNGTPALTIIKSMDSNADEDASTTVSLNDTLTYSVTVTNTGDTTLTNVTVTDNLITPNTNTCASVAPGATCVLTGTYVVTQTDVDNGQIDNTGSVTDDDVCTTACDDPNTVPVPQNPAINIVKSPATQNVVSGGTANFTLTVTNTGNVTLTGVAVTDAQCTAGPTFTGGDTNNDTQLQILETWTYSCSVTNVLTDFTNTADVITNEGATDSATADVTVSAQQVDLELDKAVSNTTPLVATNITFTITVTNADPIDATNVVVTDVIPTGFAYVSDNGGGAYNDATGIWTVGTVAAGNSEMLTITVSVNVTGPYTNYAQITGMDQVDPDSTPNNGPQTPDEDDDDSVTVAPTQSDPSGLSKSVSGSNQAFTTNPNVAIGEIVEYTVNVTIPPGVFTNAQMVDTMERGLSFMSCASITSSDADLTTDVAGSFASACSTPTVDDAGGGTTVDVGRRVGFDLGTLTNASGADQTLTFVYTAVVLDSAANVSGVTLSNSAEWSSDSGSLPPSGATVLIVEPDVSISKTANTSLVSVGSEITITLNIQHTGSSQTNAYDTVVTDVLPAELQFVPGSLICTSGAQDPDVTCAESGGTITAEWSNFALGGGNGQVSFRVAVVSLPASGISNIANVAWSSLPGDVSTPQNSNVFSTERDYDPASNVDVYGVSDTLVIGVFNNTPATGFAPNEVTDLGNVPSVAYKQTGGVTVEIPSLGITLPIVGVPLKNGEWDVSWLGNQAGWLDGTAFPSWSGNSVLTSHVYGSNGLPGPFVNLNGLRYGDKIIVRAYGQTYTYEVRANTVTEPNDASIFKHEEKAWLTLVTCKEYDEATNTYGKRVVVRAVLVGVSR